MASDTRAAAQFSDRIRVRVDKVVTELENIQAELERLLKGTFDAGDHTTRELDDVVLNLKFILDFILPGDPQP